MGVMGDMGYLFNGRSYLSEVLYDLCISKICDLNIEFGHHPVAAIFGGVNH